MRRGWLLLAVLLGLTASSVAGAHPLGAVPTLILQTPPSVGDDSIRARLKACLLMGDMRCVVDQYLLWADIGRMPTWLVAFQNAFATVSRKAGECANVARLIHEGFRGLGEKPAYVRFTVEGRYKLLGFDEFANGQRVRSHQLAVTGRHIAVEWDGRIIDAYTGLSGLPLKDYMSRLVVHPTSRIAYEVVGEP